MHVRTYVYLKHFHYFVWNIQQLSNKHSRGEVVFVMKYSINSVIRISYKHSSDLVYFTLMFILRHTALICIVKIRNCK